MCRAHSEFSGSRAGAITPGGGEAGSLTASCSQELTSDGRHVGANGKGLGGGAGGVRGADQELEILEGVGVLAAKTHGDAR